MLISLHLLAPQRIVLVGLGLAMTACVTGTGGGGGGGGGGESAAPKVDAVCQPKTHTQSCGGVANKAVVLNCDSKTQRWTVQQTCAANEDCQFDPKSAGTKLTCGVMTSKGDDPADAVHAGDSTSAVDAGSTADSGKIIGGKPDGGATDTTTAQPDAAAAKILQIIGTLQTTVDGQPANVAYDDADVQISMVHKLVGSGTGCISTVHIVAQKAKGSCKLELDFQPGDAAGVLDLASAKFTAQTAVYQNGALVDSVPCAGWVGEAGAGDVVYSSTSGVAGALNAGALAQPLAGEAAPWLADVGLQPSGLVAMAGNGRSFSLNLAKLQVQGSFASQGVASATCAKVSVPLPKWKLQDIQSKSPGYGKTYGIDTFAGKRIVILMGAGWCASCMAQAAIMEKVRKEYVAAGMSDFQLAVLVDANQPEPMINSTNFPAFKGAWSVQKQQLPNGSTVSGNKNDAYAYDYNGRLMGWFQGAGTVYTNYYEDFVRQTLKAPANGTFYMTCPNAGGSGGCKITP